MSIKSLIKRLVYKEKADGQTYLKYLRDKGAKIGSGTVLFSGPQYCNIDCQNPYLITIGKNVQITHGVIMLTHDYSWSVIKGKYGEVCGGQAPITIGDNVFIGNNALILAGSSIGDNVVVGAGSVVKGAIPSDVVVAGVPARIICTIDEYRDKRRDKQLKEAITIYRNYFYRYGKKPDESLFREYFWLFRSAKDDLLPEFSEVNCLIDGNVTEECFSHWKPLFPNYFEFEQYCLNKIDELS